MQAHAHPEFAPAGGSTGSLALQLAVGLALVATAVHLAARAELVPACALIVAAAGLGLHALPAPARTDLLFTLALVGASIAPAAAGHLAVAFPAAQPADRAAITGAYAVHIAAGLALAVVLDPRRAGCFACPDNLLLLHADPAAAHWLARWGPRAAACAETVLVVLAVVRLVQRPPAARVLALPVVTAGLVVLAVSVVANLRIARGLAAGATDHALWLIACGALGLLVLGVLWRTLHFSRVRARLARLAVDPAVDGPALQRTLARSLGDPTVTVLLAHPAGGQPTMLSGEPAVPAPAPGRARTGVRRGARTVAWLEHREGLPVVTELSATAVRSAGLALEREALRVALAAERDEVRASALRLVAAGDAERRRLERDLHDGAQQRLLAVGLALARAPLALDDARRRIAAVRDDVRRIAHGMHSATLSEGGLADAVLALVERAGPGVAVDALPAARAGAAAETAAYRLVAALLADRHDRPLRLAIRHSGEALEITAQVAGTAGLRDALAHAAARIAALDGTLDVGATRIQAEIPASG